MIIVVCPKKTLKKKDAEKKRRWKKKTLKKKTLKKRYNVGQNNTAGVYNYINSSTAPNTDYTKANSKNSKAAPNTKYL